MSASFEQIKSKLGAIGDSLAYAYARVTGAKDANPESAPPVGSADIFGGPQTTATPQGGGSGAIFGIPTALLLVAGLWFAMRRK